MVNAVWLLLLAFLTSSALADTKLVIPLANDADQYLQTQNWDDRLTELDRLIYFRQQKKCPNIDLKCVERLLSKSEEIAYALNNAVKDWREFKTDTEHLINFVLSIDIEKPNVRRTNQNGTLFWVIENAELSMSHKSKDLIIHYLDVENVYIEELQQRRSLAKRLSKVVQINDHKITQLKTRLIRIIRSERHYLNTINI